MQKIEDKSIDMILCDLPYQITGQLWDKIIPFELLWKEYKRIIKDGGAILLTAREPFTSLLVTSNIKEYKHKWVWNKKQSGSPHLAKYMPLQIDEDIICFCNGVVNYYPKMRKGKMRKRGGMKMGSRIQGDGDGLKAGFENYSDLYFPTNIIDLVNPRRYKLHPTQKPVKLFEYLIETYTKEKELVLDNCAGSGTTGLACKNLNRQFILIEKEDEYYNIILKRLNCKIQ